MKPSSFVRGRLGPLACHATPRLRFPEGVALMLGLVVFLIAPSRSRAEGRASTVLSCSERHATALAQVACELAGSIPKSASQVLVRTARVTSPLRLQHPEKLEIKLSALVRAELFARARSNHGAPSTDQRTRASDSGEVLELSAVLGPRTLRASAELLHAPRRFWERFSAKARQAPLRATATRTLDAELRSFLPAIPLLLTRVERALPPDESSLALACDDADSDGVFEIMSVGRRRIQIGKIENGRFVVVKSVDWNRLSEVAPHPLREPIASAWTPTPGTFAVGLSDRADGLRVDQALSVIARFPSQLPWPGDGCTKVTTRGLDEARTACSASRLAGPLGIAPVDTVAGARLVRQDGSSFEVFVQRRLDGRVVLRIDGRSYQPVDSVGAQIAVSDLNADGRAELITTANTLDRASDGVRVQTLFEDGRREEAFRSAIAHGARALCVCPNQGLGISPIVVASGDALWVLR